MSDFTGALLRPEGPNMTDKEQWLQTENDRLRELCRAHDKETAELQRRLEDAERLMALAKSARPRYEIVSTTEPTDSATA